MWTRRTGIATVLLVAVLAVPAAAAPGAAPAAVPVAEGGAYRPPLAGPLVVVRGFDHIADPYGPGHRGVDLQVTSSGTVLAAAAGVVVFAGPVAGRGVVSVQHADGIRTSYEPLAPSVTAGATVRAGEPIGVVSGVHGAFGGDTVLHWGARRGTTYLDPLGLLRPLGPVRLLPWAAGAPGPSLTPAVGRGGRSPPPRYGRPRRASPARSTRARSPSSRR